MVTPRSIYADSLYQAQAAEADRDISAAYRELQNRSVGPFLHPDGDEAPHRKRGYLGRPMFTPDGTVDPICQIAVRLWPRGQPVHLPFQIVDAREIGGRWYIYLITKDKPVLIEDDPALYPSDQLITKLRLLAG